MNDLLEMKLQHMRITRWLFAFMEMCIPFSIIEQQVDMHVPGLLLTGWILFTFGVAMLWSKRMHIAATWLCTTLTYACFALYAYGEGDSLLAAFNILIAMSFAYYAGCDRDAQTEYELQQQADGVHRE